MALHRRHTPYGEPALTAVQMAIADAQADDRLAAVTVVVGNDIAGVATRRWLSAHGGVAAVQFTTLSRLAERWGGPSLTASGRRPLTHAVADVIVRSALRTSSGPLAAVADHHATVAAMRSTYFEVRQLDDAVRHTLARTATARGRHVLDVCRRIHQGAQARWYDQRDLIDAATDAVLAGAVAAQRVVVVMPWRIAPAEQRLLAALAESGQVTVIEADDTTLQFPPVRVIDASDADDEVRAAVGELVAAARRGVRFERMAMGWPHEHPYARLVAAKLDAAGIPWNGHGGVSVTERLVPRLVVEALRVDRNGLTRADLFSLLAHCPARMDGSDVPVQRFERISHRAAVALGDEWEPRLQRFSAAQRAIDREADAAAADSLLRFVTELRNELGDPTQSNTYRHWSRLARNLVHRWFDGSRGIARLPEHEQQAYVATQTVLDRLATLDEVADPCTRADFADLLEAELDDASPRVGRLGVGVQIGPLTHVAGQAHDLVVVLGAADGQLPTAPPVQPLLSDRDRHLADGQLRTSTDVVADQQRAFVAAVVAAREAVVCWPRGDLRATTTRRLSRFVAELVPRAAVTAHSAASFAAAIADAAFPATASQHRVRAIVHHRDDGVPDAVLRQPLAAGLAMHAAHASDHFTDYDGLVGQRSGLSPLDRPVSPTRLELWAGCGHAYLMRAVLGVTIDERPDEQFSISAIERGNLLHRVLDRFHREVIDGRLAQPTIHGWTPAHMSALEQIFADEAEAVDRDGLTGRRALWMAERAAELHTLRMWALRDGDLAATRGATVVLSESAFGHAEPPVTTRLADGQVVMWNGVIDRVDVTGNGMLVVTDHKTGRATAFRKLSDVDPTAGGTKLQLPVYAAAARTLVDRPDAEVVAEYRFLGRDAELSVAVRLDEAAFASFGAQVADIVDGIVHGEFIAHPDAPVGRPGFVSCPFCDPDGLGTADLYHRTHRKLAALVAAAQPTDPDDEPLATPGALVGRIRRQTHAGANP